MKYDGTFTQFVDDCMIEIFDALISGGTKAMKCAIYNCINRAVLMGRDGCQFKQG
jgi:hypothetical protein